MSTVGLHMKSLDVEIFDRLLGGKSLDGLSIPTREGRVDLRGLVLPSSSVVRHWKTRIANISEINASAEFRGVKWQGLDFSECRLESLRFFDSEIHNCRFDMCQLEGLRMWSTTICDSSFQGANLRGSALGAVSGNKCNAFVGVDFTNADLRHTTYVAAAFERCIFRDTNLAEVDFQTSTFADCQFEGELRGVLFYRQGFKGDTFPPNEMMNVDFSRAKLRFVEFRGLNLDHVRLPSSPEHIVIKNFVPTLDKVIDALKQQGDNSARKLVAYLAVLRKWAGPNQMHGVLNIHDLGEIAGQNGVDRLLGALARISEHVPRV